MMIIFNTLRRRYLKNNKMTALASSCIVMTMINHWILKLNEHKRSIFLVTLTTRTSRKAKLTSMICWNTPLAMYSTSDLHINL